MKRVLAYLFIVLGLGLSLNIKDGTAAIIQVCDESYDYDQSQNSNIYVGFYKSEKKLLKHGNISGYCTEYYKKDSEKIYEELKELVKDQIPKFYIGRHMGTSITIASYQYSDFIERNNLKYLNLKDDEVVFGYERISKDTFCNQVKKLDKTAWGYPKHKVEKYCSPKTLTKKKTQIAKAEPNQTQKETNKVFYDVAFCYPKNSKPASATIWVWANIVGEKPKRECSENEAKFEDIYNYKELSICLDNKITRSGYFLGSVYKVRSSVDCHGDIYPISIKYDGKRFYTEKETQFAKAETNQKEKLSNNKETVYGSGSSFLLKSSNQTTSQFKKELCNNSKRMAIEDALSNAKTIKKIKTKNVTILKERVSKSERTPDFQKCYVEVKVDLSDDAKKVKVAKKEEPKKKIKKTEKQKDNNLKLFSKKDNLNFDKSKEIWHAVIVHKGENDNSEINIYRSDINSKINTKAKAIKNAKQKCWFDPVYDMSDWPAINCVTYYVANNKDFSKRYKIDKKFEQQIIKKKLSEEIELIKNSSKIEDSGLSVEFLGLEKKTYELALKKEQDRREELYAEACTGIIFGHKKGTQKWYECLIEKEQEDKAKGITTKVVKKEEKKKQNKKVVKKQEASQEEFKPKKTNQDNDPPIIKISNSFTVNDANYEISGTVTDESKRIFIEVDGQTIQAKKGKFTIKRYSPIDEQIQIVAIDNWGNKSEPQIVDIIIDTEVKLVTDNIEPLNPNKIRVKSNSNKVALIIGIEEYKQTPAASYANLDAKFFYEYARKGFGISKNNIKILIDEDANLISSLGTLKKWLPGKIKSNQTELIVFFAGHGLASTNGEELYLLPQDSDPDLLERTALSRNELFETIIRLNPKNVTMFFDTCFSGISRDEKTLLASARPIRIIASEEQDIPDNFTIFSASQLDQISSGIKEAKHGIFSYYLMKGLEGYADVNKDKKITNGELLAYMDENISQKASELGRQQNPSLAGDPDKVLISY